MRPLEVALLIVVALAAALPLFPRTRSRILTPPLALLTLAIAVAQAVLEGPRWQLTPAWLAVLTVLVLAARELGRPDSAAARTGSPAEDRAADSPPAPRVVLRSTLLAVTATAGVLLWAMPVVSLPVPSGPFPVGTATTVLIDEQRPEIYGPDPGGPRILPVQFWYPTLPLEELDEPEPAPWLVARDGVTRAAARDAGLPGFALSHLGLVRSNTVLDAPLAPDLELGLVLYSHGWSGFREIHITLLEELASRGYLVIAADHTYGALATQLPDSEVAALDPAALPSGVPSDVYDEASRRLVATFADDLQALLDAVLRDDLLGAIVNGEQLVDTPVGLLGHSTGGGAAVLLCSRDPRCGAIVGYDPWVEPVPDDVIGGDLQVPLLSLRSEEWVDNDNDVRLRRLHAGSTASEGRIAVPGLRHRDLTVLPLLSPLSAQLGLSGPGADRTTLAAVDRWTVQFLEHELRGRGADPLVVPPEPERTILEKRAAIGGG